MAEAEPFGDARPVAGDHDVGVGGQLQAAGAPGVVLEVQDDRAFAPVEMAEMLAEPAHGLAARRFDLEDVRAQPGQELGRVRPGPPHGQVQHAQPVQHDGDPSKRLL
ncbi:hypothetical protein GCM10027589_17670 [Actinocorallia lasiicapitis]